MKWSDDDYWNLCAGGLNEAAYRHEFTMNAVRLRIALDLLSAHRPGRLLDAGCGAGYTTVAFIRLGWDANGIDLSPALIADANRYVEDQLGLRDVFHHAPVTDLSLFPAASFDAVTCLGVMYYVQDDTAAYREFNRILKPGGVFLVSQQNEIFDLFTFNRYTRQFFRNNVFPLLDGGVDRTDELDRLLAGLMTNPDAPVVHDPGSARDEVFTRPENPLTFGNKLRAFGFEPAGETHYHGIHIVPPLIEAKDRALAEQSERKQYELKNDWRSLFMAAHFLVEARKVGDV